VLLEWVILWVALLGQSLCLCLALGSMCCRFVACTTHLVRCKWALPLKGRLPELLAGDEPEPLQGSQKRQQALCIC
jgi:hypothetical protein